ncbi:MAG TPA: hypothetical protein VG272_03080 [Candidatus Acidoferrales bacterium]|jgi:hypothetical protein|nr:hypothetical protein [Candidatus Acidoferrales bacterium]
MIQRFHIAALGICLFAGVSWISVSHAQALVSGTGTNISPNPAPSADQIHALIMRAIQNQHRDDLALQEFERVEHKIARSGENAGVTVDITERILPSTTGNIKLKLAERGVPVTPQEYRNELQIAENIFSLAIHPNDHYKEDLAKYERRRRDRAELVDTAMKAFRITWAGREMRTDSNGPHTFMKFLLNPDPDYEPINRFAASFQHVHAVLWVDEAQAQFARLEGDIATDIPFAGGIAGKVYRGGHVVMEQEEIAPGIWLPTVYTYDVDGRKFLFAFGIHERTEITHYRRIGPPSQAIEVVRNDLNNLPAVTPTH